MKKAPMKHGRGKTHLGQPPLSVSNQISFAAAASDFNAALQRWDGKNNSRIEWLTNQWDIHLLLKIEILQIYTYSVWGRQVQTQTRNPLTMQSQRNQSDITTDEIVSWTHNSRGVCFQSTVAFLLNALKKVLRANYCT